MSNEKVTIIRKIKGAKSLAYEVVHNGNVYARVLSLPLAEQVAVLVNEHAARTEAVIAKLGIGS
jgi:hypothetical protein